MKLTEILLRMGWIIIKQSPNRRMKRTKLINAFVAIFFLLRADILGLSLDFVLPVLAGALITAVLLIIINPPGN